MGDFLKDTPSLRELRLVDDRWNSFNFPLPLLNRLELSTAISIATFLDVLNNFPVLSHFSYNLVEPNTYGVDSSVAPAFPCLVSLVGSTAALCFVTLPGLREIELPSYSNPDHVTQFLARSSCTIDRLTLSMEECGVDGNGERLRIWLKAFPSLLVLHLREYMNIDVFINCLDSNSLMPRLSEITIEPCISDWNIDKGYDDALVSLLCRRTHPHRSFKLRKFHMLFDIDWYEGDEAESRLWAPGGLAESALNDLIADGLDFLRRIKSVDRGITLTWPPAYVGESPQFMTPHMGYGRLCLPQI
jgi:hypothetical protein